MASSNTMFKSHEEYRRNRELEEARKAGIAPAAVDEEGKEINPHIPQYMSSAPWYLNNDQPSLKHQKDWRQHAQDEKKFYDRGAKVFQAVKYRKGACANCGAMTHKTADCVERPRKVGAKWTNKYIAADEKIENIKFEGFEASRDRWNGYDPSQYSKIMDRHEQVEKAKQEARKQQALDKAYKVGKDGADAGSSDDEDNADEDKLAEEEEAGFAKVEKRVRTTAGGASGSVRNLRIREDTAKYLLNLDTSSAHYDPKSRSMREDPQPNRPDTEKSFRGDNFVRQNGDYNAWEALTLHSHEAVDRGQDMHMQAAPSQAEALMSSFKAKKAALDGKSKASVLQAYGSAGAQPTEDEARMLAQTDSYVEYNAQGRVIKGQLQQARSRYEEDVHPGNHTSVWGSWWKDGQWGYACCHQTLKQSYCTGEAGRRAEAMAEQRMADNLAARAQQLEERRANGDEPAQQAKPSKAAWGTETDDAVELDADKLAEAIQRARKAAAEPAERDERKRKYNSLADGEDLSAEDMEAYRLTKLREDDPLAMMQAGVKAGGSGYDLV
ncbi:hypothetical protein WJX73_009141 [Symbiochloris irregularis]|uniref:Pre-mRNA-splicing factor SLU7 n=1 Tax=Symbiochloris irregularis TaxID=706552 RepID=A0AAW1PP84_9CHLO